MLALAQLQVNAQEDETLKANKAIAKVLDSINMNLTQPKNAKTLPKQSTMAITIHSSRNRMVILINDLRSISCRSICKPFLNVRFE